MKTLGDVVLAHVNETTGDTDDGKRFLELPLDDAFNAAGNIYLAALAIIRSQQNELRAKEPGSAGTDRDGEKWRALKQYAKGTTLGDMATIDEAFEDADK